MDIGSMPEVLVNILLPVKMEMYMSLVPTIDYTGRTKTTYMDHGNTQAVFVDKSQWVKVTDFGVLPMLVAFTLNWDGEVDGTEFQVGHTGSHLMPMDKLSLLLEA